MENNGHFHMQDSKILARYIGPGGDVIVPEGVAVTARNAFADCSRLKSIRLPEGLQEIGTCAFRHCSGLTALHIPKSVTHINIDAFERCDGLKEISVEPGNPYFKSVDGILMNRQTMLCCPARKIGTVAVPEGTKRVTNYTFSGCRNVTELIFPDSVTMVGADTFKSCQALRRVVLPANLKRIYGGTFQKCTALKEAVLPEMLEKIGKYAFANSGLRRVTLPAKLAEVCTGAFWNCTSLEEVTILSDAVRIAPYAFAGAKLRRLTVLGAPHLTPSMFSGPLETVTADAIPLADLPQGPIRDGALLTTVRRILAGEDLPQREEYIQYIQKRHSRLLPLAAAHEELLQLMLAEKLLTSKDVQTLLALAEENAALKAAVLEYQNRNGGPPDPFAELEAEYAKAERVAAYVERTGTLPVSEQKKIWGYQKRENGTLAITSYKGKDPAVTVPEKIGKSPVTAVNGAFSCLYPRYASRKSVTSVTLPDGIAEIGAETFWGSSLTSAGIPAGVIKIGAEAFKNCSRLTAVTLPDSVEEIGQKAFENCKALTRVTLPTALKKIEYGMFQGCGNLKEILIPEGVTVIGDNAFWGCRSLTSITIPDSVQVIEWASFFGCGDTSAGILRAGVLTIRAHAGSYAERYAKSKRIPFVPIKD